MYFPREYQLGPIKTVYLRKRYQAACNCHQNYRFKKFLRQINLKVIKISECRWSHFYTKYDLDIKYETICANNHFCILQLKYHCRTDQHVKWLMHFASAWINWCLTLIDLINVDKLYNVHIMYYYQPLFDIRRIMMDHMCL